MSDTGPMSGKLTPLEMALLNDAGAVNDLPIALGTVQLLERQETAEALSDLTETALLKLYGQGLIMFFRASRDEGYGADPSEMTGLTRAELLAAFQEYRDLAHAADENDLLFFVATDAGREFFETLPPDSVPKPSGRIERPWEQ